MVYGTYTLLDKENPNVFAYLRELNGKRIVVLLNFTANNSVFDINISTKGSKIILDNYNNTKEISKNTLRPYEAAIIELK